MKLYNGTVEIDFKDSSHRYKVDGKATPGVTTIINILAKDLMGWAAFMTAEAFKETVAPYALTGESITKIALKKLTDESKKAYRVKSQTGKDVGSIVHNWIHEEVETGSPIEVPKYVEDLLAQTEVESERQMIDDNYRAAV